MEISFEFVNHFTRFLTIVPKFNFPIPSTELIRVRVGLENRQYYHNN